jgi:2-oxoglutarate ferredoxin oxidoreductase subunit delta
MSKTKKIHIQKEYCKGCGYCIASCPKKILEKSDEMTAKGFYPPVVRDKDECTGCQLCEHSCPDFAIYIQLADYKHKKRS